MIVSWIRKLSWLWLFLYYTSPSWAVPEVTINSYRPQGNNVVTLRLKVQDKGEPITTKLNAQNFQVLSDQTPVSIESLIPPTGSRPSPTRLVILLDVSNSMTKNDSSGQTRISGATQAIQEILGRFDGDPLKINLIPFGEGGGACNSNNFVPKPISQYLQEQLFFEPNSDELKKQLNDLSSASLCASTNIYDPLSQTLEYLKGEEQRINTLEKSANNSSQLPTQFGIILISDGFHSNPPRSCGRDYENEAFQELSTQIRNAPNITIHTLGYGLTPEELGKKWGLSRPATVEDVLCTRPRKEKEERAQEFVDQKRLAEIAKLGQGIHRFSGNSSEIAQKLEESVQAILGAYELTYTQTDGIPGQLYQVKAILNLDSQEMTSNEIQVRLPEWTLLPLSWLIIGTLIAISGVVYGVMRFAKWSNQLKQEN